MRGQNSGASSDGSIKYAVLWGKPFLPQERPPGARGEGWNSRLETLDAILWEGEGKTS